MNVGYDIDDQSGRGVQKKVEGLTQSWKNLVFQKKNLTNLGFMGFFGVFYFFFSEFYAIFSGFFI